jgi:hypothetical protein
VDKNDILMEGHQSTHGHTRPWEEDVNESLDAYPNSFCTVECYVCRWQSEPLGKLLYESGHQDDFGHPNRAGVRVQALGEILDDFPHL